MVEAIQIAELTEIVSQIRLALADDTPRIIQGKQSERHSFVNFQYKLKDPDIFVIRITRRVQ